MLATWDNNYMSETIDLWNRSAVQDGYKELTEQTFTEIFLASPYFDLKTTFVLIEENRVKGFACGCAGDDLPLGLVAGYITCIVLDPEVQTDDRYTELITALEQRFQSLGKKQADFLFFNPMLLPWYIPGTPKHEHNNAPGVPVGSKLYAFLLRYGYVERAQECGMYLPLGNFSIPEDIRVKEQKAAQKGYRVGMFDPVRHTGVEEMLDGLDNPLWRKQVPEYIASRTPILLADHQGKAAGFAGPVIRQDNGRGFFIGIGVHPAHEGHGLGSLLFFKLCEAFRDAGTEYMSLFTGTTNPAIRIYEKAGFKTVKPFAIMRREF